MAKQAAIHRYTVKCPFGIGSIPDSGVYAFRSYWIFVSLLGLWIVMLSVIGVSI